MPTFTPPVQYTVPPTLPKGSREQLPMAYKLFRHYGNRPEGRNVYIFSDGSVSEIDPDGTSTLWTEADRMGDTLLGAPHVVRAFYGGHDDYAITDAEAALLIAAGYEVTE